MKFLFLTVLILTIWACCSSLLHASGEGRTTDKPNIVIIMADDLDSRQLSCYGGRNIRTPNIDALAAEGLRFSQMIASETMCVPTRASMFTGLYPARHGAYQNHKPVYSNLKSVAHYLDALGYTVALTGKDHATTPKSVFPFKIIQGFEPNCRANADPYFLDSIKTFIGRQKQPYCLFVMSINPHVPWTVGDPSEFDERELILPPDWVDTKATRGEFARYLAEIRRLDNQVGDVLQLLKDTGQDDNTIVIFLGEQGAQFPGGKYTLWNSGQYSSMIVKWPNVVQTGTETSAIVQYEDITPTLIDIAGGSIIPGLDGRSFLNVLIGKSKMHRAYAYGIQNNIPEGSAYPVRSISNNNYKLILNLMPDSSYYTPFLMTADYSVKCYMSWIEKAKTDPGAAFITHRLEKRPLVEFYDLKADPYELNNLADSKTYRSAIRKMKKQLLAWMAQQGDKGAAMDVAFSK